MPVSVAAIVDLLTHRGAMPHGAQTISPLEHALQCAQLVLDAGEGRELVISALLHDIGHLLDSEDSVRGGLSASAVAFGAADSRHESRGAAYLNGVFSERIVAPIRLHVTAKRYLCAVDPNYWSRLSTQSKYTLELQGGPLSAQEAMAFSRRPYSLAAVSLRRFDDFARSVGRRTLPLEFYIPLLESCALRPAPVPNFTAECLVD